MRIQAALNFISLVFLVISISSLLVVFFCIGGELDFLPFLYLFILSMFLSSSIYFANRNIKLELDARSSIYSIFLAWPILILMGSIPLLFIFPDHSFFDILFISSSLSTTTGSWFFNNVIVPGEAIIWQSALQWLGGLLTLVIACSFVEALFDKSSSERTFFDLSKVKVIFFIYLILTIIFSFIMYFLDLTIEESIRLSISLLSTSNAISSSDTSIFVTYDSKVMSVMILGMFLGSLSVNLHYKAFISGISSYFKDKSVKYIFLTVLVTYVMISMFSNLSSSHFSYNLLVNKLFIIFSLLSTTGYIPNLGNHTEEFSAILILLLTLAFIGGSASSTTGGMKISRLVSLFRYISNELHHLAHPMEIISKKKETIPSNISLLFVSVILFMILFLIITICYTIIGIKFETAFLLVTALITNTGRGILELNNLHFFPSSPIETILSVIAMLIGRIETILIMLFISKAFWLES